jgi:hypothetical protein
MTTGAVRSLDVLPPTLNPADDNSWYSLVYENKTGAVVDELPLIGVPQWQNLVNTPNCSGSVATPVGDGTSDALTADRLRTYFEVGAGRFGVAVCYGTRLPSDWIGQAGPAWVCTPSDDTATSGVPSVVIGFSGFWSLLMARLMAPASWTNASGISAVALYGPLTLRDIARSMLTDALTRGTLPLDVPAAAGDSGTDVRNYPVSDLAYLGQRLQELTQVQSGPDICFQPYFSAPGVIRHQALIGNPYLTNTSQPVVFDYGTNLISVIPPASASGMATRTYAKGSGTDAGSLVWGYSADATLENNGWPVLEGVDSGHTTVTTQTEINGWANADQAQNGRVVKAWSARVRLDGAAPAGGYAPGQAVAYNMQGHFWIPDGLYTQRLLGIANGPDDSSLAHILDAS